MKRESDNLSKRISSITGLVVVGMVASIAFHYCLGVYLHMGYPFSTFLFRPNDALNDYRNMYHIAGGLSPYNSGYWFNSNYFPLCNLIFYFFSRCGDVNISAAFFLLLALVFYSIILALIVKRIKGIAFVDVIFLYLFNYPVLFAVDRANVELYIFLFIAFFAYFYHVKKHFLVADVFLALAISMKLYPAVFLVIFFRDRRFSHIVYVTLLCGLFTIISLMSFHGGVRGNIHDFLSILSAFNANSSGTNGIQHNATLFGLLKLCRGAWSIIFSEDAQHIVAVEQFEQIIAWPYTLFVVAAFISISAFSIARRIKDFELWSILVSIMILFPTVSYDYKLVHLLIPLTFFLVDSAPIQYSSTFSLFFGLLLIPKDYIMIYKDVSIASAINPIILLAMMALCLLNGRRRGIAAENVTLGASA